MHIWHPKDRFPDDIAGQFLVGDFVVIGEYEDGGMEICAAGDETSLFPRSVRTFIVKDMSSGLAPDNYYGDDVKQPRVRFTERNPLVFLGKLHPARYAVKTRRGG